MSIGGTNAVNLGGSTPVLGDYRVRYYDIDGTVLKEQWVNSGENATPPNNPNYDSDYLIFDRWNASSNNITYSKDIGAIYNTVDGKTYVFLDLKGLQDLTVVLLFTKHNNDTLTVEWGDGTSSTYTTNGTINTGNHTYPAKGEYIVKISISGTGYYTFGQGGNTTPFLNYDKRAAYKLYIGSSGIMALIDYCFYQHFLSVLSIPYNITLIYSNSLASLYTIKHLTFSDRFSTTPRMGMAGIVSCSFPDTITSISDATYKNSPFIEINPLKNIASIGAESFANMYNLAKIDISGLTYIGTLAFSNVFNCLVFIIRSTSPPTLSNINVFTNINQKAKIYVPDASVNIYKTATNWSTYADYIYPLSTLQ